MLRACLLPRRLPVTSRIKWQRALQTAANKTTETQEGELIAGTTPPHAAYLFLRASRSPQGFPKVIQSELFKRLKFATSDWEDRCLVNMRYDAQDRTSSRAVSGEEEFRATLHVGRMETHEFTLTSSSIDSDLSWIQSRIENAKQPTETDTMIDDLRRVYLYVCTHAAVDCRCGEHGPKLVEELRRGVELLKEKDAMGNTYWQDVRVMETGHIGGHKYAANMLVYPHGDWFGNLRPSNVPALLQHVLSTQPHELTHAEHPVPPPAALVNHWRGRMGLTLEEQKELAIKAKEDAEKEKEEGKDKESGFWADVLTFGFLSAIFD